MNYPLGLKFPCAFILFFCCGALLAQSEEVRAKILAGTRVQELNRLAAEWSQRHAAEYEEAVAKAEEMGWPLVIERENSRAVLVRLSESGWPMYISTDNADAAISTQVNLLHGGGLSGLNLEGNNMTIAQWDGGKVRLTHEQLSPRSIQVDGATSLSNHATHVAGTLIGNGIANTAAKGMAPQAILDAYDFNSDYSEMAAAAANGLLISNHSYGYLTGWNGNYWWGDTAMSFKEDRGFGAYYVSQWWDSLTYLSPYYLIVKSAGNDRNNNPPGQGQNFFFALPDSALFTYDSNDPKRSPEQDGGTDRYESIPWQGNAKNILTVGAVADVSSYSVPADVVMSPFSSWGPTDDGRIKPDLVGNGVSLSSSGASADNHYYNSSGTSMSSPNVAGSLLLLQEHYINSHGMAMKASTLKALAIHTARECGSNPGPDYQFGWGLLSTKDAADLISTDTLNGSTIQELSLSDGQSLTQKIVADGSSLRVTICWTDPPAVGADVLNDRSPRLIHDLDVMLNDGLNTFQPYVLDVYNPSAAATTGDNDVDNVEQVYIANPTAGQVYTITINHEGSLLHNQDFALIISGQTSGFYSANTCTTGCDAGTLGNWNSEDDGSGFSLPDFEASDRLVIQSGHTVNVSNDLNLSNTNLTLVIENGATLNVSPEKTLTVAGGMENNGVVNISTAGSLLQTDAEDKNAGNGLYHITRNTGDLANHLHYQFWSSPVDTASVGHVFAGANPIDYYQYHPQLGWQNYAGAMQPGRGYISTPTVNSSAINFNENRTFSGQINNGVLNYAVSADSGDFILAGNPYPSAFRADSFVAQNPSLNGSLYFFNQTTDTTHQADYAAWNKTGATHGGRDGEMPDNFIQSCQGFFVQAIGSLNQIGFNNSGRAAGNNLQFFKRPQAGAQKIWLSAEGITGASQILLGFTAAATFGEDRLYDAPKLNAGSSVNLYSYIGQKPYVIQGRPEPVFDQEMVRLGFETSKAGTFEIAIDSLYNWPRNRQVFLFDSLLAKTHNLHNGAYQFQLSTPDTFANRFYLHFLELKVGKVENAGFTNEIWASQRDGHLHVYLAEALEIKSLTLSALSGQTVLEQKPGQRKNEWVLNISSLSAGVYLLQLRDEKGHVMRLKIYVPSG